jgi:hypothetical protein
MTPVLYAFGQRFVAGDFNPPHIFWRSSPRGVDLLAFVLPNPNHLLTPGWIPAWLTASSGGDYLESVASIPWVALAVVGVGLWRGWRSSRSAALLAIAFTLLALGPFVYIAGVNTHVPGPWALLRYVPVMGLARTPARFVAVVMMMTAAMFAASLAWLVRHSRHRSILIALVGIALVAELVPLPRTLYSASIPAIYRHLAAAPETMRVLHMPFGIRDGRSSLGDFSAQTEFFQTAHQKPLMGGYLSRVSDRRRLDVIRHPILGALATLSERQPLADGSRQTLLSEGRRFVSESQIGFVVLDRSLVSDDVCSLMVEAFGLELIDRDGVFELYRPKGPAEAGHHDGS